MSSRGLQDADKDGRTLLSEALVVQKSYNEQFATLQSMCRENISLYKGKSIAYKESLRIVHESIPRSAIRSDVESKINQKIKATSTVIDQLEKHTNHFTERVASLQAVIDEFSQYLRREPEKDYGEQASAEIMEDVATPGPVSKNILHEPNGQDGDLEMDPIEPNHFEIASEAISSTPLEAEKAPASRTGFVYDRIFEQHCPPPGDQCMENPHRVTELFKRMESTGLISQVVLVPCRPASKQELLSAHSENRIQYLQDITQSLNAHGTDLYISPGSWNAIIHAAGGLIELVDKVASGQLDSGFAAIRPPGHHAGRYLPGASSAADEKKFLLRHNANPLKRKTRSSSAASSSDEPSPSWGYCLINNVAIAAKHLQEARGLKRIAIIDFDIHHGEGTQQIFEDDPGVLYISIHRYKTENTQGEADSFYPGSGFGHDIGAGRGQGFTINVPLDRYASEPGHFGDEDYLYIFDNLIMPILRQFNPEFILVSCGLDCSCNDPYADGVKLSENGFKMMIKKLQRLMDGKRIVLALEGGYNAKDVAKLGTALIEILVLCADSDARDFAGWSAEKVRASTRQIVKSTREAVQRWWKCLQE